MGFKPSIIVHVRYKTAEEKRKIFTTLKKLGWVSYREGGIVAGTHPSTYTFEWTGQGEPIYPKDIKYIKSENSN